MTHTIGRELADRVGEELPEQLRTAFRRFGGLPRMIRAPQGQERIIETIVAEVRAAIRKAQQGGET